MPTTPPTPERLLKLLENCAANPGTAEGKFTSIVTRYTATRNAVDARLPSWPWLIYQLSELIQVAAALFESDETAARLAEIAVLNIGRAHSFVPDFFSAALDDGVKRNRDGVIQVAERCGIAPEKLAAEIALSSREALSFGWSGHWRSRDSPSELVPMDLSHRVSPVSSAASHPYESYVMATDEIALSHALLEILGERGSFGNINESALSALAAFRPAAVAGLMERAQTQMGLLSSGVWGHVLKLTGRWDGAFLKAAKGMDPGERMELLDVLRRTERLAGLPEGIAMAREAALDPQQPYPVQALLFFADFSAGDFEANFIKAIDAGSLDYDHSAEQAFAAAARQWSGAGQRIFGYLLDGPEQAGLQRSFHAFSRDVKFALRGLLNESAAVPESELRHWFREAERLTRTRATTTRERNSAVEYFWATAVHHACDAVAPEFLELLGSSSQGLRENAVRALGKCSPELVLPTVLKRLTSRRADERQGSAEFLLHQANPAHSTALAQALATETIPRVRQALHEALTASSTAAMVAERNAGEPRETSYLPPAGRKLKAPSADWLAAAELPALYDKEGTALDAETVTTLIVTQGAHKSIAPSPDLLLLYARIDRTRSGDFARELLDRYLEAAAPVEDRWAMTIAGMLGDITIIPLLQARIPAWCQERRYKLAEYAAQAMSLLPGNEPLAALDALSKRYHQKFRNVGVACETACATASKRRGLSEEELRDVIVPSCGFDLEGVRTFTWPDHSRVQAVLGESSRLTWTDAASEKTWKSFPASAPPEVQKEVKAMIKLLKDTAKAQIARLESALVRQRRWGITRWQEIFDAHPLLRSVSGPLVWGIYDEHNSLLRTFRRYPNGLLADATGTLEELKDQGAVRIGLVHPLDLDAATRRAWSTHLTRLKSKPPFAQIDRPCARLDPQHGNRALFPITQDVSVIPATLRAFLEKRGWQRPARPGEKIIPGYTRHFPEHGLEAVLPTPNLWTFEALNPVTLPPAFFLKDHPALPDARKFAVRSSNDPALVKFADIPPVAWSETICDLQALTGNPISPPPLP